MIIVTGATGALNAAVVEHLLQRMPPDRIGVSVRDPRRAQHLADRGVRVRRGSYDDPKALANSFEDAEQVLLVSSSDRSLDHEPLHRQAIGIAAQSGASRILYTSHQNADATSPFRPAAIHAAAEADLASSGVAWTALRNGFYAHSLDWLLGPWLSTDSVVAPQDGPVSWTDRNDQAEAIALILDGVGTFDGPVTLTAREAPTFATIADLASTLVGHRVERIVMDDDEWAAKAPDPQQGHMMLGFFQAARRDDFAATDPTLADLLRREPRTVGDLLAERVAAHRAGGSAAP